MITAKNWNSFHFGEKDIPDVYGKVFKRCYVLFADFCNFTKFFSSSDNLEDIEPLFKQFYTRSRESIHMNEGMLDKILGDGFIAVWGLPKMAEHAEQKIFACVKELNLISLELAEEWQSLVDVEIDVTGMRFGLSKGRLITINRNEAYPGVSILGDPLNMAARLQSIAEPQHLACSNRAYHSLKKLDLNFKAQGILSDVKGFGAVKYHSVKVHDFVNREESL